MTPPAVPWRKCRHCGEDARDRGDGVVVHRARDQWSMSLRLCRFPRTTVAVLAPEPAPEEEPRG